MTLRENKTLSQFDSNRVINNSVFRLYPHYFSLYLQDDLKNTNLETGSILNVCQGRTRTQIRPHYFLDILG
jgi:hypothetical protein